MPLAKRRSKPTDDRNVQFVRAFNSLLRSLLDEAVLRNLRTALREESTVPGVMGRLGFFDPDDKRTFEVWDRFAQKLSRTYEKVIEEAAREEARRRGWKLPFEKAKDRPALTTADFIRRRSLTRVVDLSNSERDRVRGILVDAFESGQGFSSSLADKIKESVGLTDKQRRMVERRVEVAVERGATKAQAGVLLASFTDQTRMQRARAIARTETNDALNQGLQDTWRRANDEGLVPPGTKKQWSAANDDRSSEVCQALDGQVVGLDENFAALDFVGPSPPAHPNCRSTMNLVFP